MRNDCKPKRQRVCKPDFRFEQIFSKKESGLQLSVQKGIETISPKLYNWSPEELQAVIIEAL